MFQSKNKVKLDGVSRLLVTAVLLFSMLINALLPMSARAALTDGLTGHWHLDEGSGTTTADASGNSNTGTLNNSPTWLATGLDGSGSGLAFSHSSQQSVSTPVAWTSSGSISVWANSTSPQHFLGPAGWTTGTGRYVMIDNGSGSWRAVFRPGATTEAQVTAGSPITQHRWYHLAMTWENTGGNNYTIELFVDGVSQGTTTWTGTPDAIGNFYIGRENYFTGRADEVRVYNRAITDAEALEIFQLHTPVQPTAPGQITDLQAAATSGSKIGLSWTAPADGGAPITGYMIERRQGAGSYSTIVANTNSTDTTYTDTGLSLSTQYTYRVSTINAMGTGTASNEATATTTNVPDFADGDGSSGDPYQISSCQHLQNMADYLSSHFVLAGNIDCSATSGWNSGEGFIPVGEDIALFTGSFDGNGHTISDLFINRSGEDYVGLFGATGGATIADVVLSNVDITGAYATGGLIGYDDGSGTTITGVTTSGSVTGDEYVGGLVGELYGDSVTDSGSSANVTGGDYTGGLVGYNGSAALETSYATGDVTGNDTYSTGGLIGENYGSVTDSYATGDVTGVEYVGGLIGYSEGNILRAFSVGAVSASSTPVGGLIGENSGGTVTDSFWNTQTSGQASSSGGTGRTTTQLKDITTFVDAGWSITTTSTNRNDGYPFLSWETGGSTPTWYVYVPSASDGDGVDDAVENAGPNGGDANQDADLDSTQGNVGSFVNSITGEYAVLELDSACTINSVANTAESANAADDSGFSYPVGLTNFTADCGTPGYTTDVSIYYYGVDNTDFILRKYNSNTDAYFNVEGATISEVTIDGQPVIKVSYQVTDGGSLDIDGTADGTIIDPVGLALGTSTDDLANTGQNTWMYAALASLIIGSSLIVTFGWRKKQNFS